MPRRRRRRPLSQTRVPRGRGSLRLLAVLAILVGINLYVFLWRAGSSVPAVMEKASMPGPTKKEAPPGGNQIATAAAQGADMARPAAPKPAAPAKNRAGQGKVEKGDSLGRILRRIGLDVTQTDEVIRSLRPHMDFRAIRVGQKYRFEIDPGGALRRFEFTISRTQSVVAERNAEGVLVGRKNVVETQIRVEQVGGSVEGSLYQSIKALGEETELVGFLVDVFAYDLNFYVDTHKGDTFRILVEKEYAGDDFLRYRNVLAAEYSGRAGTYRAYYFKAPGAKGDGGYYDEKGRSLEKLLLKTPLKFGRISSKFNRRRMHPILHRVRAHLGVDYAAPTGTPVRAAAEGRITFRSFRRGGGNMVVLRHDNGLETVYMHLSKFRRGQRVGQRVKGKVVIGYVGSTGMSTGPHLHFAVRKNGSYVDPMKIKMSRRKGIPRRYRGRFATATRPLEKRLAAIPIQRAASDRTAEAAGPDKEIQATHPAYRDVVRARKAAASGAHNSGASGAEKAGIGRAAALPN